MSPRLYRFDRTKRDIELIRAAKVSGRQKRKVALPISPTTNAIQEWAPQPWPARPQSKLLVPRNSPTRQRTLLSALWVEIQRIKSPTVAQHQLQSQQDLAGAEASLDWVRLSSKVHRGTEECRKVSEPTIHSKKLN